MGPRRDSFSSSPPLLARQACSCSSASRLRTRNSPALPKSSPTRRFSATSRRNAAGFSVDLVHRLTTDEDAYRFIEQVLAKLAPQDAAFLVHPEKLITMPFDDNIRRQFATGTQILSSP